MQLCPGGQYLDSHVREFLWSGHKIWEWQFDEASAQLFHIKAGTMDVYVPSQVPGFGRRPNCWTRSAPHDREIRDCNVVCLVKDVRLAVKAICSYMSLAPLPALPATFWDVMVSWECTWMWESIQLVAGLWMELNQIAVWQ